MRITKEETYHVNLDTHNITIQYYPEEHKAEISSDILRPKNGMEDEEILKERLGLQYEEQEYGEPAYSFVEVFLEEDTGIQLKTTDEIHTLLEP